MKIRESGYEDMEAVVRIYDLARDFMQQSGTTVHGRGFGDPRQRIHYYHQTMLTYLETEYNYHSALTTLTRSISASS